MTTLNMSTRSGPAAPRVHSRIASTSSQATSWTWSGPAATVTPRSSSSTTGRRPASWTMSATLATEKNRNASQPIAPPSRAPTTARAAAATRARTTGARRGRMSQAGLGPTSCHGARRTLRAQTPSSSRSRPSSAR